ncbi:MAG: amidohydrolase family protein [Planctomycetes bacterium]|nr:amidohydrolase family protein [Planctomycetota bacterium]MCC7171652.1 amidohydrolase family protein [Planctomycetota bacterium]
MAGAPIKNGVVLIKAGKITAVGPESGITVAAGTKTLRAKVVTPGLIDAHTAVGFSGLLNQPHDQDQFDRTEPMQPELRAIDAYNARDPLVAWVRGFGVTTIHTGHAAGPTISGQTMIAKTRGETVDEAVMVPAAMVAAHLGTSARSGPKAPGTRAKSLALLRAELTRAVEYRNKRASAAAADKPELNLRLETLTGVLDGKLPLLVTADSHQEIVAALHLQQEFGLRLVLDSAADAHLVRDAIKAARVPVLVHPTMTRVAGERRNASFTTAAALRESGIPIALQSGFEDYVPKTRVVLFEAAIAAANGLTFDRALGSITIDAARILGIDARVGSLEIGKDGDVALYDGDPFEYTTHCVGVAIDGVVVSDQPR